ncbi:MAG TPA: DedA family protein [Candidatus Saccharimonadales bacterium]|nr:DedA family protein [Candidatus Saccharimonadales bacterium]
MLDVTGWIEGAGVITGLIIIGAIVFAESGLLIGFFLPGDTLLFTAGFFAAQGRLPLAAVMLVIFFAAIIGDNVGYYFGKKTGPRIFRKKDGILFRQEYLERAETFYEKHGGKTIMIARFVPYVRTFAPIVAGAARMPRGKFVVYNILGALIWTVSVVLAGYWLGSLVDPHLMERFLLAAIGLATLLTFGPTVFHLARDERVRAWVKKRWHVAFKKL